MELLRIVAMFLVLVVHADFLSLGSPTLEELQECPSDSFGRIFFQSLSIVCVNVFVLISGWFGIRPKLKSFCNLVFQCLFFFVGAYIVLVVTGEAQFSIKIAINSLFLFDRNWFVISYIGLYILIPIVNAFIDNASEKRLRLYIIVFFAFQTIFGISGAASFIAAGYSSISFIGLYMLARYICIYTPKWSMFDRKWYLLAYFSIVIMMSVTYFICLKNGLPGTGPMYTYINPLVIASSLCLLLYFSKLNFSSHLINILAVSTFAVFLLHTQSIVMSKYFIPIVQYICEEWAIAAIPILGCFFVLIFIIAICLDQIRLLAWRIIEKYIIDRSVKSLREHIH